MPKLRVLSGQDVLRILDSCGSGPHAQRGSHVKVRRLVPSGAHQSLTVPLDRDIDRGTLIAIYRQACRFVPEQELRDHFFG
jgi:predicted RNA binding protein YcfA (HicA-like mRNA interferase family)